MEGTNSVIQNGTVRFLRQAAAPNQPAIEKGRADFIMQMRSHEMNNCIVSGADSVVWHIVSEGKAQRIFRLDLNRPIPGVNQDMRTLNPINEVNPLSLLQKVRSQLDFMVQGIEESGGRQLYQLVGKLKAGVQSPIGLVRLWIGVEDSFLYRIIISDAGGRPVLVMELTGVRLNPALEDALFVYAPPADANVVDFNARLGPAVK